jgi:hypothetical protein
MSGIHMGEISKVDKLIGLVKHAIWAEYQTIDKVQKLSNPESKLLYPR